MVRGVASGTASRALASLDFWLAGPIKPIFQRVPCTATRLLDSRSDHSASFSCTSVNSGRGLTVTAHALQRPY